MKRSILIISIPLIIILCFVGITLLGKQKPTHTFPYDSLPALGEKDAPVKIVEFGDYKCPACQHFSFSVFPQIEKNYIEKGLVQVHFANFPFIATDSYRAAEFAETVYQELGDETFWAFNKSIYLNQKDPKFESQDYMNDTFLMDLLSDIATSDEVKKVVDAYKAKTYADNVTEQKELARKSGANGTPAVFVNGKIVDKSMDIKAIERAIEEALETNE